jgi:hypothetical protein
MPGNAARVAHEGVDAPQIAARAHGAPVLRRQLVEPFRLGDALRRP